MTALRLLLVMLGIGIFGSAGALVVYDVVVAAQMRRLLGRSRKNLSSRSGQTLQSNALVPERWRRTATSV